MKKNNKNIIKERQERQERRMNRLKSIKQKRKYEPFSKLNPEE